MIAKNTLPYFDLLLLELQQENRSLEKSFGKYVHWGYWPNPATAQCTHEDYYQAAENLNKKIIDCAEITDNQTILDVGCGFGGTLIDLNERYSGMKLAGLNIDERQLQRAQELAKPMGNNQINFVLGNASVLPFAKDSFDNLLAVECIFHFPSRECFFKEAKRVLKPGGRLTLSDFIPHQLLYPAIWIGKKLPLSPHFFGYCDFSYTLSHYQRLATKYGFVMEAVDITSHTLPTYSYLTYLSDLVQFTFSNLTLYKIFIRNMYFLTWSHLLGYYILSFKKQ